MKITTLLASSLLAFSMSAFADLIYDAGEQPSHGPSGEEVTLEDPGVGKNPDTSGEAKQVGKNKVEIEKPYEYDANSVPDNDIGSKEKD